MSGRVVSEWEARGRLLSEYGPTTVRGVMELPAIYEYILGTVGLLYRDGEYREASDDLAK